MQISYLDYYRNQNMDLNMHMNCACVIKNVVRKTTHGKEQELVGSERRHENPNNAPTYLWRSHICGAYHLLSLWSLKQ